MFDKIKLKDAFYMVKGYVYLLLEYKILNNYQVLLTYNIDFLYNKKRSCFKASIIETALPAVTKRPLCQTHRVNIAESADSSSRVRPTITYYILIDHTNMPLFNYVRRLHIKCPQGQTGAVPATYYTKNILCT